MRSDRCEEEDPSLDHGRRERAEGEPPVSPRTQLSPRGAWALGLMVAAMGIAMILLAAGAIGPDAVTSESTPRWVGICAGLVFLFGGVALIIGYAVAGGAGPDGDLPPGTPWWLRLTQYLLGLVIVGSMTAIASWVAFGPGSRTFSTTIPFVGRGPASEIVGRSAFWLRGRADGDLPRRIRVRQRAASPPGKEVKRRMAGKVRGGSLPR